MKPLPEFEPIGFDPLSLPPLEDVEEGGLDVEHYRRVVCDALDLPQQSKNKMTHFVGHIRVLDADDAVDEVVFDYRKKNLLFTYLEYLDALKRRGKMESQVKANDKFVMQQHIDYREWDYKHTQWLNDPEGKNEPPPLKEKIEPEYPNEIDMEFLGAYNLDYNTPDRTGYLMYVGMVAPDLFNHVLLQAVPIILEEELNRPNTYILGKIGSGKSELLKVLISGYVEQPNYGAVVVLDPAGDFVWEVAHWEEFLNSKRLIYVRPYLKDGLCPVINPFQIYGVEADDYTNIALRTKRVVAQELVESIGRIVVDEGGQLTGPMKTILQTTILVLLDKPGASFEDLLAFVGKDTGGDLKKFAQTLKHHRNLVSYFADGRFDVPTNQGTKDAIQRRLDRLLTLGTFADLTCGKSTIELEKEINAKKIILIDCSKGASGLDEGPAFGKLITGMLLGIARRRQHVPIAKRTPCVLVADECHNFLTPSIKDILLETRKYRFSTILAQQMVGDGMSPDLKAAVLQSSNMKFVGFTPDGSTPNANVVGADGKEVEKLRTGEFFYKSTKGGRLMKVKIRADLLGNKNSVTGLTWKRTINQQIKRHYQGTEVSVMDEDEGITDAVEWD